MRELDEDESLLAFDSGVKKRKKGMKKLRSRLHDKDSEKAVITEEEVCEKLRNS